nr:uncharacterized protein LOC104112934 [Nicotiana tomentosiformis]
MRNIKEAIFPKPIRSNPSQRDPNVATLLKNGHLREFLSDHAKNNYGRNRDNAESSKSAAGSPQMTINMLFGGDEVNEMTFLVAKKTKISVTHGKRIWEVSKDDITFKEEDANGLLLQDNDALEFGQHHKIESLDQAKLIGNIILATKLLAGINLTIVTTRGEVLLPTHAEGVTKTALFEVVYGDMGYNMILGRSWIHEIKVLP